ncbi:enoyl-[acyl-carrier protein] reductase/trans-2-enoyl-CoA reductase (NAD+) [Pseudomonas sp. PvR086]|mgnify:CR=1 FL=1|jgi:enoyl-[acyl-carrier protein] reductase/trans-2-enoyl-CoA reductase (NAD+)|uniref:enoyl-ACP reductase FabV n=1 Tax=Pseudomonas TaxID=286 RepID=UPI000B34B3F5|nr:MULTISPECIES: enoyl-ACP reductase FabV [Pseudomonas]MBD9609166.1 trans-2-enoyl-CoA reductase family protein [Pseudomonas sp. PDM08]MDR7108711.1 enoyl-[acyl-carrier protein] reductase/trans-2-enoyl-CoA reductase (NAD+) [Pseudomonas frederiksbergensis]PMY51016.1 enoyl-[acyl-carrier-protein] reductase FabV [Pseudomonas sp. FW305-53]PMY83781.1 enoyl-[acyl-carrier-protein] reductase FabV [Pseudomonas sp. FW303-C2]PMY92064.1 enoyl-[acyl-carrier-protein] reductase FabV [Pseudomonas sp. FW305-62]
MIIKPRVRGFVCVTTHPTGCEANVKNQIDYVTTKGLITGGPKNVLVIGASTGYGLAARITAAFGCGASTLGVFFEREGDEGKLGTAGWYNTAAFHTFAESDGLYAKSINGDAFSDEIKQKTIDVIKRDFGKVDLVVYSLAAPRRTHPKTGEVLSSTLKPLDKAVTLRGLDTDKEVVKDTTLQPAIQSEIDGTVAVMGGEDWQMWIDALHEAGVLADGAKTTAFTYLGEKLTHDIYWNGSIGAAKKDLDQKVLGIRERLAVLGGDARVSVLKAVVTQASSAIPIMPLYLSLLFKVMKEQGTHEGCVEQVYALYKDSLYGHSPVMDQEGRLRADYKELAPEVQDRVKQLWDQVSNDNLYELTDFVGYKAEFLRLFGFGIEGVDYEADVDPDVKIYNLLQA